MADALELSISDARAIAASAHALADNLTKLLHQGEDASSLVSRCQCGLTHVDCQRTRCDMGD